MGVTLKGRAVSLGRALKSKDSIRSTSLWGRRTRGKGELKVRPPSTTYSFFMEVGYISKILEKVSEILDENSKELPYCKFLIKNEEFNIGVKSQKAHLADFKISLIFQVHRYYKQVR